MCKEERPRGTVGTRIEHRERSYHHRKEDDEESYDCKNTFSLRPILKLLYNEPEEQSHGDYQRPCLPCTPAKEVNQLTDDYEAGKDVADICNPVSETIKLFIERSLD